MGWQNFLVDFVEKQNPREIFRGYIGADIGQNFIVGNWRVFQQRREELEMIFFVLAGEDDRVVFFRLHLTHQSLFSRHHAVVICMPVAISVRGRHCKRSCASPQSKARKATVVGASP